MISFPDNEISSEILITGNIKDQNSVCTKVIGRSNITVKRLIITQLQLHLAISKDLSSEDKM